MAVRDAGCVVTRAAIPAAILRPLAHDHDHVRRAGCVIADLLPLSLRRASPPLPAPHLAAFSLATTAGLASPSLAPDGAHALGRRRDRDARADTSSARQFEFKCLFSFAVPSDQDFLKILIGQDFDRFGRAPGATSNRSHKSTSKSPRRHDCRPECRRHTGDPLNPWL